MKKGAEFRLLRSFNKSAKENMAIDKALVKSFNTNKKAILRFYTWEKSFTVGLSQELDEYMTQYSEYKQSCAKRMTGGGVLFHGHDVSYSLLFPTSLIGKKSVKESYEHICSFLLTFYKNLGLEAKWAKDDENIVLSKSNFCQVGYEAYDIIVNGVKIGGNAQKRSRNMIFQHGSIPIKKVTNEEELGSSLVDLGIALTYEETIDKLINAFKNTFEVELEESALNEEEKENLKKLL